MEYNLEKRTFYFAKEAIKCSRKISLSIISKPIISQFVRSATSVGANYCEAINGVSKKDFRNKIFICKKELQETIYWLDILIQELANNETKTELENLKKEAIELIKIFQKSIKTLENS
jgi:four helix bundle protein